MVFVSVLCATYNRQHLIPYIIHQYNTQTYPKQNRELIIYDDSDLPCHFESNDKQIRYIYDNERQHIGFKRNFLNKQAKGDIIIWQDDDDYYFTDRIQKTVDALVNNKMSLIGVKNTIMYDTISRRCFEIKHPQNYTQNNIMAYTKEYLRSHSYEDSDKRNEERHFTSGFSEPLYAFNGKELCIHIAHKSNTASKNKCFRTQSRIKFDVDKIIQDKYAIQIIKQLPMKYKCTFHWINLKKDNDRRKFMQSQFDSLALENSRFEAVTPDDIKYSARPDILNKTRPEEFACMCSHLLLLRSILKNYTDEHIVILEDDIHLKKEANNIRAIIANAPNDWDILQLHHVSFKNHLSTRPWAKWDRSKYCTTFYVITRTCADRLVSNFISEPSNGNGISFNFDTCTEAVQADNLIFKKSKTYTLTKPIATTNMSFDTNIQLNNWEKKKLMIHKAEQQQTRSIKQDERREELRLNQFKNLKT